MMRIKINLLTCLFLLVSYNLFATYSTDWIKPADNYQKSGTMIARDKSDNLVVTGYITSNNIYTRKYDKFGNFLWEKTDSSGIHSIYEKPRWVNCDNNKNIYVVGYQYSTGSGWEYPNAVIVLKYSPSGTLLWKKIINLAYIVGSSSGYAFNLKSEMDSKNNLFIGTAGTSPSGFILIKLNSSGTIIFNNTFNLGGIHQFASMRLKGNKVVITGGVSTNYAAALVAWDTAGTFLWNKFLTGQSGADVEIDGSGNTYLLTSYLNQVSSNSAQDILVYKLNPGGSQIWKKKFDFGGQEFPTRFTLVSGKLSIIGYCTTGGYFDWITLQVNTSGTLLWSIKYNGTLGNDEAPYAVSAKANGEVFVTGKGGPMFTQVNGSSYLRMVTLKYGNTGTLQWLDTLNIYSGWGISTALASDSSLFVLGGTNMTAFHFLDHTGTGSCGIPSGLSTSNVTDTSATFSWTAIPGAYLYHLRYKVPSAAGWTTVSTNLNTKTIKTLSGGTTYNYAVEAVCSSGPSGYSSSHIVTTTGAGYCTTGGLSTTQEFLNLVWIGGIINQTMSDNGYGDYTNLSTPLTLGSTINGYLSGFLTNGLSEYYRIWIDYNQDNDFNDPGESVVNISSTFLGYIAVNFTVPVNATPGPTRMRITMCFDSIPVPCGIYPRGETEDYSVNIVAPIAKPGEGRMEYSSEKGEVKIFPNPFSNRVTFCLNNTAFPVWICIFDVAGKLQREFQLTKSNSDLDLSSLNMGIYFCVVKSKDKTDVIKLIKN